MPPRYKDISKCRSEIEDYAGQLDSGTDSADPELRNEDSTRRHKQDLRWYDHWLDDANTESTTNINPYDANQVGQTLSNEALA
jgi:integrase/recombinase XerD